jgi:chloramphenicol O-acetyltransferase type A
MQYIDINTWDRREYFQIYVGIDFPYINIGANIDVTNLLAFSANWGVSSYIAMVFFAHRTAQAIENFRYRIVDGKPAINESMRPSFTYIPEGRELFINVTLDFVDDILRFHENAKAQIAAQGTDPGWRNLLGKHDIIAYSAIPWIQYTHFVRTIARLGVDSNPKISWGKYFDQGDRVLMPFSVQVHHGLMDGIHVGRYFEELQRVVEELD